MLISMLCAWCCLLNVTLYSGETSRDAWNADCVALHDEKEDKQSDDSKGKQRRIRIPVEERDDFCPELFPHVRQLHLIASRVSAQEQQEREAYVSLYRQLLISLLPRYSTCVPPVSVTSLKPVSDFRAYVINASRYCAPQVAISTRLHALGEPYSIEIPLFRMNLRGDLTLRVPATVKEAYGRMAYILADFTAYNAERRHILRDKCCAVAGACIISSLGATTYVAYQNSEEAPSVGAILRYTMGVVVAQVSVWMPLTYGVEVVHARRWRHDQRSADIRTLKETPSIDTIHPWIQCLARDYASDQLFDEIISLRSRRNVMAWIRCCPIFDKVFRVLRAPVRGAVEINRIGPLLDISHRKLQGKLRAELVENYEEVAAHNVCTLYRSMIDSLYVLDAQNLDAIIENTAPELELTQRRRMALTRTMRNTRRALRGCMSPLLRKLDQAHTQREVR